MADRDRPIKPLPERKEAFASREVAKGKGIYEPPSKTGLQTEAPPRGTGPLNRHGMPRLPVGQRAVPNWPVLDLGAAPSIDLASWRLRVDGLVGREIELTWGDFMALPQVEDESDFHCVTTWSRYDMRFTGVRFRDLIATAAGGAHERASHVFVTAYDHDPSSDEPYTTNLPLAEAMEPDVLLVHAWEEKPLPREHGGPCRMVTPRLYAWKGAKWIRRITLADHDTLGFWEKRGYSSTADPWHDDRYARH
jgi:DMSO/TMAO reductase YedYZ molybdopterin-dependent catalytic subunit